MKNYCYLLLFFLFYSCSTQLYVPVEGGNSISLKKGRELYVANCSSCHQLFAPNKYNEKEWLLNLDEMQPKAKISNEQKKLIFDYLVNVPK